jgi:hypothetical protein
MQSNLTQRSRNYRATAALGLFLIQLLMPSYLAMAAVQYQGSHVLYQDFIVPAGIGPGQMLRYTWINLNETDPLNRVFEPSQIQIKLLASDGSTIAEKNAAAVEPGLFQRFDFKRDQLTAAGDPGTGRLQVLMEVKIVGRNRNPDPNSTSGFLETFEAEIELIDTFTGQTIAFGGRGANQMILNDTAGNEEQPTNQVVNSVVGIIPGQSLRISIGNHTISESDASGIANVKIIDSNGSVIGQSDELLVPQGGFRSFEFCRSSVSLPGELSTGRLQVRVEVSVSLRRRNLITTHSFDVLAEVVDSLTGRTTASSKPKEIVVVGSQL